MTSTRSGPGLRVHIVGGGIGGLTTALFLSRAGHEVRVFERAPELADVGAGLTLWPNALRVLAALGLGPALSDAGRAGDHAVLATSTGRVLTTTGRRPSGRSGLPLGIHRARLHELLRGGLPAGALALGRRATGFVDDGASVVTRLDDAEERCDMLIGADGVQSTIRAQLIGDGPPRYAGYTAFRGITPGGSTRYTPGEFWGRGRRFGVVPIAGDRLYWFATVNSPHRRILPVADRVAFLLRAFGDWAFGIPRIIAETPAHAVLQHDIVDRPPRRGWCRGRVGLIGDAAHPMTPNLGQGAAMAIEDAAILARSLARTPDPREALAVYERTRAPRTGRLARTSRRIGALGQTRARWVQVTRDLVMASTPAAAQVRALGRLTAYDALTAPLATPALAEQSAA